MLLLTEVTRLTGQLGFSGFDWCLARVAFYEAVTRLTEIGECMVTTVVQLSLSLQ